MERLKTTCVLFNLGCKCQVPALGPCLSFTSFTLRGFCGLHSCQVLTCACCQTNFPLPCSHWAEIHEKQELVGICWKIWFRILSNVEPMKTHVVGLWSWSSRYNAHSVAPRAFGSSYHWHTVKASVSPAFSLSLQVFPIAAEGN